MALTESDTRILLPHILTLLVGEEHVSRKAALGRVGIYADKSQQAFEL